MSPLLDTAIDDTPTEEPHRPSKEMGTGQPAVDQSLALSADEHAANVTPG